MKDRQGKPGCNSVFFAAKEEHAMSATQLPVDIANKHGNRELATAGHDELLPYPYPRDPAPSGVLCSELASTSLWVTAKERVSGTDSCEEATDKHNHTRCNSSRFNPPSRQ